MTSNRTDGVRQDGHSLSHIKLVKPQPSPTSTSQHARAEEWHAAGCAEDGRRAQVRARARPLPRPQCWPGVWDFRLMQWHGLRGMAGMARVLRDPPSSRLPSLLPPSSPQPPACPAHPGRHPQQRQHQGGPPAWPRAPPPRSRRCRRNSVRCPGSCWCSEPLVWIALRLHGLLSVCTHLHRTCARACMRMCACVRACVHACTRLCACTSGWGQAHARTLPEPVPCHAICPPTSRYQRECSGGGGQQRQPQGGAEAQLWRQR